MMSFSQKITKIVVSGSIAFLSTAAAAYDGFGKDIPLSMAMSKLVPAGWRIDYADGVDNQALVSWSSASSWKVALNKAIIKHGYAVHYERNRLLVVPAKISASGDNVSNMSSSVVRTDTNSASPYAFPSSSRSSQTMRRTNTSSESEGKSRKVIGGAGFLMTPYHQAQVTETSGHWRRGWMPYAGVDGLSKGDDLPLVEEIQGDLKKFHIINGLGLRTTLDEWASKSGWKLVWDSSYSYPVSASATYVGNFDEASTALITAMGNARPAITMTVFEGNKVVVIGNDAADDVN
ncbi:toxin co-regulated pilus biosynthesis Q family protein [Flexibacterium corallicola]|uniref:toxin co-regulated pilus biosynthesis Q family protein n=1 Tax=Flexibacterium corallicola TaxID=3037259 RepID=UPI00286FA335|nr:toxin co-regulated pilus biosynthesis Q family protein [Pseudovibrio sp. M1P-2-3]